jgi:hypothetical protein
MTESNRSPFYRFADTVGDGSGIKDHVGNYTSPTDILMAPPAARTFYVERLIVFVEDVGTIDPGKYGTDIVLVNGVTVALKDDKGVILDLTDGKPIMTNAQWGRFCYDMDVMELAEQPGQGPPPGRGHSAMVVRWSFFKGGAPLVINGARREYFAITLHDDFSDLVSQTFMLQGNFV